MEPAKKYGALPVLKPDATAVEGLRKIGRRKTALPEY
jgi:hypothetical protein